MMSLSFRNPTQAKRTNLWRNDVFQAPFNYGVEFIEKYLRTALLRLKIQIRGRKSKKFMGFVVDFQNTPDNAINVLHDVKLALKNKRTNLIFFF